MEDLLEVIKNCTICQEHLVDGCRPVLVCKSSSKIIIIGQAPGRRVHESGIPWHDKSGDNLRKWLGVSHEDFYDANLFAIIPMGFCFPGTGKSGDLPPRKECAPQWHPKLLEQIENAHLTLLIGSYAQKYYLGKKAERNLTETVKNYRNYLPHYFPLPHPSPRNNIWMKKNPWFEQDLLPVLRHEIKELRAALSRK
jgi:uracil-DNA glycosylase family 4